MNCYLCPRNCGADREKGIKGFCGQTSVLYVARAALHFWEEPCISGEKGSGTVFFSGCQLKCVYCQNKPVADGTAGKKISLSRLSEIFLELQEKGAHNINLVTGDHYTPQIKSAVIKAKSKGLIVPVIFNCSGYEKADTLKTLEGIIDIYMPDFKYLSSDLSRKYSNTADYPIVAKEAIIEMVRQQNKVIFDKDGIMKKGVLIRHLLLPGCLDDSKKIVEYLYTTYGNTVYYSLMSQYTPLEHVKKYPELSRRVTFEEYDELIDFAVSRGMENAFIQEGGAAEESFIPVFDYEGV